MRPYSVKLTIEGLHGSFADKYSYTVRDAHHLHRLFAQLGARAPEGPIDLCRADTLHTPFDPMALLPRLMRYLVKVGRAQTTRRFFTGARAETDDGASRPWAATVAGVDEQGPLEVRAWGTRALVVRDLDADDPEPAAELTDAPIPVLSTRDGHIVCRFGAFGDMFTEDIKGLIEMCEETVAKNTHLLATEIPHASAHSADAASGGSALPGSAEL